MQEPTLVYQSRFTRNSIFSTSNTEAQSPSHRLSIISAFQPSDPHATSFYPATRIEYEDNRMLKESDAAHRVMNVLLMISLQTVTSLYAASISSASANANLAIACCVLYASIIMVNLLRVSFVGISIPRGNRRTRLSSKLSLFFLLLLVIASIIMVIKREASKVNGLPSTSESSSAFDNSSTVAGIKLLFACFTIFPVIYLIVYGNPEGKKDNDPES